MKVPEQMLINELNKLRRKKSTQRSAEIAEEQDIPEPTEYIAEQQVEVDDTNTEIQESELLKFLFSYGNREVEVDMLDEDGETIKSKMQLAAFIVMELQKDKMIFQNPLHQAILEEYEKLVQDNPIPDVQYFVNHSNPAISAAVIELLFNPYELSGNWKIRHRISVPLEDANLMASAVSYIYSLKLKKVDKMMAENLDALKKATNEEDEMILIQRHNSLMEVKREFAKKLTRIVTK
jgi:DNA primase